MGIHAFLPLARVRASSLVVQEHLGASRLLHVSATWCKRILPRSRHLLGVTCAGLHLKLAEAVDVRLDLLLVVCVGRGYPGVLTGHTTVPDRSQGRLHNLLVLLLVRIVIVLLFGQRLQIFRRCASERRMRSNLTRCLLLCSWKHCTGRI